MTGVLPVSRLIGVVVGKGKQIKHRMDIVR